MMPIDTKQMADIFLYLHTDTFFSNDKIVAYARIKGSDANKSSGNPEWIQFKDIEDPYKESPGTLLCTVQMKQMGEGLIRMPREKTLKAKFTFFAKLYYGFELAPEKDAEELNTFVEVKVEKKTYKTKVHSGKYPIWY